MGPSHARKRGIRYRYYVTSALLQGQPERAGSVRRVPAARSRYSSHLLFASTSTNPIKPMTENSSMPMLLGSKSGGPAGHQAEFTNTAAIPPTNARWQAENGANSRTFPGKKPPSKRKREIIVPKSTSLHDMLAPIRAETCVKLVTSIALGRRWLEEMVTGSVTMSNKLPHAKNAACARSI